MQWVAKCSRTFTEEKKVQIIVDDIPSDINSYVITEKQWLLENVMCLMSNALKFTNEGKIVIRCKRLSTEEDKTGSAGMLLVEVVDSGIGVPEEKKSQLFKPYSQTMQRAGGTGLGLFSLLQRVECLGGSCGVRDGDIGTAKQGACFWFTIPYRPDHTVTDNAPAVDKEGNDQPRISASFGESASASVPVKALEILLAEDSKLIQKTTVRSLTKEGFVVVVANNGQECLQKIAEKKLSSNGEKR
jgi:CheY-like chemotaxis protein